MAKPIVLQKLETLEGGVTALQRDALQFKGHFNGDLSTLIGSDKVGIYALQHQCINTPNDTDKYVFERAILTVKSDGVATTQELTATHIGYPTYVGKHYKRTGWIGEAWQPWRGTDDKIAALQSAIDKSGWSVEGSQKIIPNVLFIGGDYNTGKWGCISGQTLNMPPGVTVGIKETLAYNNNSVTIRVTENQPMRGRVWTNSCDGTNWTGWATFDVNNLYYGDDWKLESTLPKDYPFGVSVFHSKIGFKGLAYCTVETIATRSYVRQTISLRDGIQAYSRTSKTAEGVEWGDWKTLVTSVRIDISSKLVGGWQVLDANCSIEATIIDGVLFANGLVKNNAESSVCLDLSQYPPKDGKWHGGSAVGGNGNAKYFVIDPQGSAQFQAGYEKGVAYTLNFNYRVY